MSVRYNKKNMIPGPVVDPDSEAFWNAISDGKLVFQKCGDCGKLRHPPRPVCPKCRSLNIEWEPSSGKGTVYSKIIYRKSPHPGLKAPYTVVLVELDEGVKLVSNMMGIKNEDIKIGMQVEAVFHKVSDELNLPKFRKVK